MKEGTNFKDLLPLSVFKSDRRRKINWNWHWWQSMKFI